MDNFRRLEEIFCKFPGIGPRQAKRFVYHLLNKSPSAISEFTKLVEEAKKQTHECGSCHRLFIGTNGLSGKASHSSLCAICLDNSRDKSLLMVVARDSDFESVEKNARMSNLFLEIIKPTVELSLDAAAAIDSQGKGLQTYQLLEKAVELSEITGDTVFNVLKGGPLTKGSLESSLASFSFLYQEG
jgi:recombinational DNA repair protein RecR